MLPPLLPPLLLPPLLPPLLLLLLASAGDSQVQRVIGRPTGEGCACEVNLDAWSFPVVRFEAVLQQVENCNASLTELQRQVKLSYERLPQIQELVQNLTTRLQPYQYLNNRGLYSPLALRQLGQELSKLESNIDAIHSELNNDQTKELTKEMSKLRTDVSRMQTADTINMKTVKEKLRYLKNSAESCKSIPQDFRGHHRHCMKGLLSNISDPVITKISPYGKSYTSGSWGKQAQMNSEEQKSSVWIQPLTNSHIWGNVVRIYPSHKDFMASANYRDFNVAPSYSHTNAMDGPGAVLYGDALYYHCYRATSVCRYDLTANTVARVTLPGDGVGVNNRFPYCYYDCRTNSDVDVEADETGLWVIYATQGNHGNLVVSRLEWNAVNQTLNVTQTWETGQFKKAVSNAFMACGVLYATRYVDEFREEVFYAFDTATGRHDGTLALRMEKVVKGMASVSYNPTNRQLYMYNDGYLLAYQAHF